MGTMLGTCTKISSPCPHARLWDCNSLLPRKDGRRAEDERAARGGNLIPSGKDEGRAGDFCSCCQVNLVVLLPRGALRDPGTRVCVSVLRDRNSEQQKEDGTRWLHSKPLQCPAQSDQNPVLEDPPTQIRFPTKQLREVGGSGNYGRISPPMERAGPAYQCLPFEQSGTQKKEAFSHEENKRERKVLIKDKGNLFHSALYCDLNLLEVRAKRAANPN
ncbi:uncharacterized protein LOC123327640 [Bubalus bubalis]|uniref:uncharacterized protein LOC123327640 n=1 Tax=Bubalus bubalis TaxID=89462 RepID=UPI001D0FC15F|nr:uncharacterized protein LOC123327640 [Bubalus bubalis]